MTLSKSASVPLSPSFGFTEGVLIKRFLSLDHRHYGRVDFGESNQLIGGGDPFLSDLDSGQATVGFR